MIADPGPPSPIRVALRFADGPVSAFVGRAIDSIVAVPGSEIVLVVRDRATAVDRSAGTRLRRRVASTYERLERAVLRGGPSALTPQRPPELPDGIPVIRDDSDRAWIEAVADARPDVVIDLAVRAMSCPRPVPALGWWRLCYDTGSGANHRSGLVRPTSATDLATALLSIEQPGGTVLAAEVGHSAVHRIGFARDRDSVYWRAALLPARRLARIRTTAAADTTGPHELVHDHAGNDCAAPAAVTLPPYAGLALSVARKLLDRILFRTGWVVLVRRRKVDGGLPVDLSGFEPVKAPVGRFFADPFVQATPDGERIYVEDCPDGTHRGRISVLAATPNGSWQPERIALADIEHRAYPHVIPTPDGLVVTPDGGRSGGVDIFIDRGPGAGFEHVTHCLEHLAISDSTMLWHADRYWLFAAVTGHGMSPWDELHLYSSATLRGLWHPHPRNPVVADVRRARPAGRIFRHAGRLIRPGQDCSEAYGRRIVLSAIATLNEREYEEHPIGSIEPEGAHGIERTHTYTFDGSIEALDGYRRAFRFARTRGAR